MNFLCALRSLFAPLREIVPINRAAREYILHRGEYG